MITNKIHYCWFGGNPLPPDAIQCIASWKKYFPDYEIVEWNEHNFDVDCCPYVKGAYEAKKYAFVSDYARFYVLYHFGGVYFDTDVEVIRDMTHIINHGSFMGFEKSQATNRLQSGALLGVNPGLGIGAPSFLPFYKEVLNFYESKSHFDMNEGTVVDYTTHLLRKHGLEELHQNQHVAGIDIYTADYFCPMDSTTGIVTTTENTVSIHHYSCTWMDHHTISWKLHLLKNWLIGIFGEKFVMGLRNFIRK